MERVELDTDVFEEEDASFNNGKSTYQVSPAPLSLSYPTEGLSQGTVDDFKSGWAAVAAACKSNPKIKMLYVPPPPSSPVA